MNPVLPDLGIPGATELLSDDTGSMLSVAVSALGGELLEHRPYQSSHGPGRRFLVHYDCASGSPVM